MRKSKEVELFGRKVRLSERSAGERFSLAEFASSESSDMIKRLPRMNLDDLNMSEEEKQKIFDIQNVTNLSRIQSELKYHIHAISLKQSVQYWINTKFVLIRWYWRRMFSVKKLLKLTTNEIDELIEYLKEIEDDIDKKKVADKE